MHWKLTISKGVVENNISSSFTKEQWEEWLDHNVKWAAEGIRSASENDNGLLYIAQLRGPLELCSIIFNIAKLLQNKKFLIPELDNSTRLLRRYPTVHKSPRYLLLVAKHC